MTKSQINRIGDKLRATGAPDEGTLEQLQQIRSLYKQPMATVQRLLKERLEIDATARLKTINTIVEKLRREKTRLAEMQDIAGL
jgi:ppGpp synthetase/RelA/SpoT-type nucleotidyltranferase